MVQAAKDLLPWDGGGRILEGMDGSGQDGGIQ